MKKHTVNTRDIVYPTILDPSHYAEEKNAAYKNILSQSTKRVDDYFFLVSERIPKGELGKETEIFDLTDSIGFLLGDGEVSNRVGSAKKIGTPGDLVISRLRSYLREIAIVPDRGEHYNPLFSTEYYVLRSIDGSGSEWLLPYLLSNPVQTIFQFSQTGSNHPRFMDWTLIDLPIPDGIINEKDRLTQYIKTAISNYENTRNLYRLAMEELDERLEINNLRSSEYESHFVRNLKTIKGVNRLDSDFYQDRYLNLRQHLQSKNSH